MDNHVLHTVEVSLLPLAIGLLIGLLAEVFRRGYAIRQELEHVI